MEYESLFIEKRDKSDLVATFLAVLELVKGKRVRIEGEGGTATVKLMDGGERHWKSKKIRGAIEAILFASGDAVSTDRVAQVLSLDRTTAAKLMQSVMDDFNTEDGGVRIVKFEALTRCAATPRMRRRCARRSTCAGTRRFQAAMEVLAIVAYNQPVTKAFVEQIRGVDCSGVLGSLTAKGLIEERGRLELPGRPLLYGTTSDFLRCLNISSLSELPPLPHKQEETEEKKPARKWNRARGRL